MRLDPAVLADLAIAFRPTAYVRLTPMAHALTPLGAGYGATRFASPAKTFKVIYFAEDLCTSIAETIVRDRCQGRVRRRIMRSEADLWGATEISATTPLTLIDLRTTGLVRLGVSTDAARGKAQGQGRKLSMAVHDQTNADGFVYRSRLTGGICVCAYERAATSRLAASPVVAVSLLAGFVAALDTLQVAVVATP